MGFLNHAHTFESPTQPRKQVSLMIVAVTAVQPSCQPFSAAKAKNCLSVSLNPSRIAALTFSLSRGFSIFSAMILALRQCWSDSEGMHRLIVRPDVQYCICGLTCSRRRIRPRSFRRGHRRPRKTPRAHRPSSPLHCALPDLEFASPRLSSSANTIGQTW